ncbi:helix-turn-helix domain-containing protein [Candidatus Tisiphia endosymbiont of Neophilaenus lineatus]|uniref:helix-turn-helix domain-containing protein n=1 Tax=Candidatus Tisiphia endosymbiont of Neophilaenus lineatus TaxID=3139336 RepID=UPI0035C9CE77
MGWIENIKEFLRNKMEENQLKASDLAELAVIPTTTMRGMLSNRRPEIKNIIKLANYFDCSVDEVLNRKGFEPQEKQEYMQLSPEALSANLKSFITEKMNKNKMTQYELGVEVSDSPDSIRAFLREDGNKQKMLSTGAVIAIADYFKVSIDEILGRTSQLGREKKVDISLGNLKTLSPEVLKAAQLIGKSIASDISPKALTTDNVAPSHVSSLIKKSPNSTRGR